MSVSLLEENKSFWNLVSKSESYFTKRYNVVESVSYIYDNNEIMIYEYIIKIFIN